MLEYLHLKNVGPAPEMDWVLEPRLNLLTGDNGLGKSFLLDIAWWALTRRWPAEVNAGLITGRMARPTVPSRPATIAFHLAIGPPRAARLVYEGKFNRQAQAWRGTEGRSEHSALVLYAQVDGSFAIWDPARNAARSKGKGDAPDRPPAYVFAPREVWDGLQPQPEKPPVCNGLIRDWARWQDSRGASFQHLTAVLDELSPDPREKLEPGELTRISLDDARDIPTLRMPYGQDVPVLHASAGMRRIIAFAYLLVWCWEEHMRASKLLGQPTTREAVFLIDEVEAHLHPRWQRVILRALRDVVRRLSDDLSVQLITTTHSPLVMASVEPWFDAERDAWCDMDLVRAGGKSRVQLQLRPFVRRGDISNWLTSGAFDLKSARSEEAESATEKARALLASSAAPTAEEVREVDGELRKVLSDIDPFWVRWSAFMERHLGVRP
jgi:AAA domain, putative AbiEii toxin, Type IV TA system